MNTAYRTTQYIKQNKSLKVDLKALPYEQDESPSKMLAYLALFFGGIWSLTPLLILFAKLSEPQFPFELALIISGLLLVGLAIVAYGFHLLTSKRIVTFHKSVVRIYTETVWKGKNTKTLPYSVFKGVLMDEYTIRRENQPDQIFQTINLVHEDKSLTVKLYEAEGKTPPRTYWKNYIKAFETSALQKDGNDLLEVGYDDLDLSLQERSKRQYGLKQEQSFSAQDIPQGLEIQHQNTQDGDQINMCILTNRMSPSVLAIFSLVPVIFMALPFFATEVSIIFPAVGGLFFLVIMALAIQDHQNKREITITRSEIMIKDIQPQGKHKDTVSRLSLSTIENILIKGETFNEHIVIIGKEGEISTGTGLSDETLRWLQNYLRAAVVTA